MDRGKSLWPLTGSFVPPTTIASGEMVFAGEGGTASPTGDPVSGAKGVPVSDAGSITWRSCSFHQCCHCWANPFLLTSSKRSMGAFTKLRNHTSPARG